MITLHKFNGEIFTLNASHIETVEEKPDTVITLVNDRKYLVKESMEEVLQKTIEYFSKLHVGAGTLSVERLDRGKDR